MGGNTGNGYKKQIGKKQSVLIRRPPQTASLDYQKIYNYVYCQLIPKGNHGTPPEQRNRFLFFFRFALLCHLLPFAVFLLEEERRKAETFRRAYIWDYP